MTSSNVTEVETMMSANPIMLYVKTLREYLVDFKPEIKNRLYVYPAVTLAVYRELTEVARQFVIRILFIDQPVPRAVISSWISQNSIKEYEDCETLLGNLNIWRSTVIPGGLEAWELCPIFKRSLRTVFIGGENAYFIPTIPRNRSKRPDVEFLDNYAMTRWHCLMHYLIGMSEPNFNDDVNPDAVKVLISAGLMRRSENRALCTLTQLGFQYLLLDIKSQVWHFLVSYLDRCDDMKLPFHECFGVLFQLSLSTLGRDYSCENFSPAQLRFLQHLREIGLVFQRKRKEGRFYPTRLVININRSECYDYRDQAATYKMEALYSDEYTGAREMCAERNGFIILETNFRLYAHTDSALRIAILGIFCQIKFRAPRFTVCLLTRESVRKAFRVGITAKQIIHYLEIHAHKTMHNVKHVVKTNSVLPPTVIDQIYIWENELKRLHCTRCFLYKTFLTFHDFVVLRDYAQSINAILFQNERTKMLVVTAESNNDVKKYWKQYSANSS